MKSLNINKLIDKTRDSRTKEMLYLIESVRKILNQERINERTNECKIEGKLVNLPSYGKLLIVGDLHGDLSSLEFILKNSDFLSRTKKEKLWVVFLGDYGDRGKESAEVYYTILTLKRNFPQNIILLMGNHEFPRIPFRPHDLPAKLVKKYGSEGKEVYEKLRNLFSYFYIGAIVKGKYIFLHGGFPTQAKSLKDIALAHKTHPSKSHLEEILWNDPKEEIEGSYPSPRGAGRVFGPDVTKKMLRVFNVKTLVRSHEPCEGTEVKHDGRILTLFSRRGPPYHNSKAAYLKIDLSEEAKDAQELSKKAVKF